MSLSDARKEWFSNMRGTGGMFDEVHIVDVAGRMKLRHEECVHIPEFGLDQRAPHFPKAHAHQLRFDGVQKLPIGMSFSCADPWRAKAHGVFPEPLGTPTAVLQHFGTELGDFFRSNVMLQQMLRWREAGWRHSERSCHTVVDAKRFFRVAPPHGVLLDNLPIGFCETFQFARTFMHLLQ
jgi:hypothetical protein